MIEDYLRQYGLIAIFGVLAILVPAGMLLVSLLASRVGLRPSNPTPVKSETYECGVEALGGPWNQFNFRYYMFAILFVIFDVEVVFLYPWATKFLRARIVRPDRDGRFRADPVGRLGLRLAEERPGMA